MTPVHAPFLLSRTLTPSVEVTVDSTPNDSRFSCAKENKDVYEILWNTIWTRCLLAIAPSPNIVNSKISLTSL